MAENEEVSPGLTITLHGTGFLLVHKPSGKYLDWFAIYHRAIECARELSSLYNWEKPEKTTLRYSKKKVEAILKKHQF